MDPWWTQTDAGLVGGGLGAFVGVVFGGIGGGIGGPLAARGRARGFVTGFFKLGVALGVLLLVGGIVALALGQPFHVWFWLAQPGLVLTFVMGALLPVVNRAYRQHEERRLAAEELRRS
ncbi:MAG: hypothetical protein R3F34_13545 [Planctomycetota bacterium]